MPQQVHDLAAQRQAELLARAFTRSSERARLVHTGDRGKTEDGGLEAQHYLEHVQGTARYGAIPFVSQTEVGWVCVDIDAVNMGLHPDDPETFEIVDTIVERLGALRIRALVEHSKSKGFHVWVFFDGPASAADVRRLLRGIAIEAGAQDAADLVCPRQDRLDEGGVGNGTWLPLFGADHPPHTRFFEFDADSGDWVEAENQAAVLRDIVEHPNPASAVPRSAVMPAQGADGALAWILDELREDHGITLENVALTPDRIRFACPLHESSRENRQTAVIYAEGNGHCSSTRCEASWRNLREFVHLCQAPDATSETPESLGFSGPSLLALVERPKPEPISPGVAVAGHFNVLLACAFEGKSSLCYWAGMGRAAGVAPWPGAPARPQGRVLFLSPDEGAEQAARRMMSLGAFHPAGRLDQYADRITVLGPDRELPEGRLGWLSFDQAGLDHLREVLRDPPGGEPFAEVYVDAYADVLPPGASENSNEDASRIGGALEAIAVETGAAITLLHHISPKRGEASDEPVEPRSAGRGATALAAKARVVTVLERVRGLPHLRRLRVQTNLDRSPRPLVLQVASEEGGGDELLYFRPFDPLEAYTPERYLVPGEATSTRQLAKRLAGMDPETKKDPPGDMLRLAAQLREEWTEKGRVSAKKGAHGAKCVVLGEVPRA